MSEKIAVVTTGGTIGSLIEGRLLAIDRSGRILRDEIATVAAANNVDVEIVPSINKHSEDIEPDDWSTILHTVENCLAKGVKRIIITHGTDTLPYTAAAVDLLFGRADARICLTGSFYSLEHPRTDVQFESARGTALCFVKRFAHGCIRCIPQHFGKQRGLDHPRG